MPLCKACKDIDLQRFRCHADGCLRIRYNDTKRNAHAGCDLCSLVLAAADDRRERSPYQTSWIRLSLNGKYNPITDKTVGCTRLHISVGEFKFEADRAFGQKPNPEDAPDEICVVADQDSPAYRGNVVKGRYLGEDRTSPEYIGGIKQWLDDCTTEHSSTCAMTIFGGTCIESHVVPLPSRCIDLGGRKSIFLRDCSGMRGCYIILSHRWTDETSKCKTTRANYEARTRGAGFQTLSRNLQDVMLLAQKLGVRYIWVDSLCIVQDDEADLHQELVKMAQYYQNALCTLAVEVQHDGGLLQVQGGRPFDTLVRLPYREAGTQKGYFYVYRRAIREDIDFMTEVDQSELLRRGWVCQEWFLSRRIIHVAPTNTYLECRSQEPLSMSNYKVKMIPDWVFNRHVALRLGFKTDFAVGAQPIEVWYKLASLYSQMLLTDSKDHLNAIAGLASEFALLLSSTSRKQTGSSPQPDHHGPSHQEQYSSGLWLPDIHHGLLWQGMLEGPRECHCEAPSWSWLSFAGPISWFPRHESEEKICEILSVTREEHDNPDFYLITQPAALQLKGKLQPVLVQGYMPDDVYEDVTFISGHRPSTMVEAEAVHQHISHRLLISPLSSPEMAAGWGIFDRPDLLRIIEDGDSEGCMTLALCVALHHSKHGSGGGPKGLMRHNVADVLFLEPVEEGEGRFRRAGVGSIFDPDVLECFGNSESVELMLL